MVNRWNYVIAICYVYLKADSLMLLGPVRAGFGMIRELWATFDPDSISLGVVLPLLFLWWYNITVTTITETKPVMPTLNRQAAMIAVIRLYPSSFSLKLYLRLFNILTEADFNPLPIITIWPQKKKIWLYISHRSSHWLYIFIISIKQISLLVFLSVDSQFV